MHQDLQIHGFAPLWDNEEQKQAKVDKFLVYTALGTSDKVADDNVPWDFAYNLETQDNWGLLFMK